MPKKKKVTEDLQCGHPKCLKTFGENESAILCDNCQVWFHSECSKLDEETYTFLKNTKIPNILWHCDICLSKKSDSDLLGKELNKQQEEVKIIKQTLVNLQESMSKNFEKLEKNFNSKVNNQKTDLIKSYSEAVGKITKNLPNNQVISSIDQNIKQFKTNIEKKIDQDKEMDEMERKKFNVIVFNVPESKSEKNQVQEAEDISFLKKLFHEKIILKQEDIKAIYRIPRKRSSDLESIRPIIIKLTSLEKRSELLKLRNLTFKIKEEDKRDEDDRTGQVYIAPDRTKKQVEEHKKLLTKKNDMNKVEEANKTGKKFIIQRGKIVLLEQPFRRTSQPTRWESE